MRPGSAPTAHARVSTNRQAPGQGPGHPGLGQPRLMVQRLEPSRGSSRRGTCWALQQGVWPARRSWRRGALEDGKEDGTEDGPQATLTDAYICYAGVPLDSWPHCAYTAAASLEVRQLVFHAYKVFHACTVICYCDQCLHSYPC